MAALNMPSGFRFHPTDMELIQDYLARKCYGLEPAAPIVAEIDMYNYDPWILPELAWYGEKEWFFFSPIDRKSHIGARPNRTAGTGYWRATGPDKPIGLPPVGIKKSLVFFAGKSPQGFRTNWMMQEYRLVNGDRSSFSKKDKHRLDRWVLCRLYNKKGFIEKYTVLEQNVVQAQELVRDLKRPMIQAKRDLPAPVKRDSKVDQGVGMKPNEQLPLRNWLPQQMGNWVTPAVNCIVTHRAVQTDLQPVASFSGFLFDAEAIKMEEELEKQLEGFDYSLEGLLDDDELHGESTVTQVQEMNDSITMEYVPGINPWQPMQLPEIQCDTYMYPSPKQYAP